MYLLSADSAARQAVVPPSSILYSNPSVILATSTSLFLAYVTQIVVENLSQREEEEGGDKPHMKDYESCGERIFFDKIEECHWDCEWIENKLFGQIHEIQINRTVSTKNTKVLIVHNIPRIPKTMKCLNDCELFDIDGISYENPDVFPEDFDLSLNYASLPCEDYKTNLDCYLQERSEEVKERLGTNHSQFHVENASDLLALSCLPQILIQTKQTASSQCSKVTGMKPDDILAFDSYLSCC